MVKAFNKARKNNRLYVRLISADAGRRGRRRDAGGAAAIGAGGVRCRPQWRRGQPAVAARRSASGRFPRNTPSAAPRLCRSTWTTTEPRPAPRTSAILHHAQNVPAAPGRCCHRVSFVSILHGAGARFWEVGTLTDFLKGDVTSLSIDLHGRLVLGPALTELADTATRPCSGRASRVSDGDIYGRLRQRRPAFCGSRATARAGVFFDSAELEVHALARAPGGGLYVGTSPDGRIYKVDAAGKSTDVLRSGRQIHLGAGGRRPTARCSPPPATRASSTASRRTARARSSTRRSRRTCDRYCSPHRASFWPAPNRPAACSGSVRTAAAFSLLDAGLQEISALRARSWRRRLRRGADGQIVGRPAEQPAGHDRLAAAAAAAHRLDRDHGRSSVVEPTRAHRGSGGPSRESGRASGKGAVYRIQTDGAWDQVWTSADDAPYDVALDGQRRHCSSRPAARARSTASPASPRRRTLLTRAPAQQVTTLIADGARGLLLATANPGKILPPVGRPATTGSYESEVRDAEAVATWGAISWRGAVPQGTDVRLFTRSGNTRRADDTWSPWSAAYRRPEGEQITSPKARYLQWKVELAGAGNRSPVVTSVTAAYPAAQPASRDRDDHRSSAGRGLPAAVLDRRSRDCGLRRRPPIARRAQTRQARRRIRRRSGGAGTRRACRPLSGRRRIRTTTICTYDVLYRREGETTWKALKREPDAIRSSCGTRRRCRTAPT